MTQNATPAPITTEDDCFDPFAENTPTYSSNEMQAVILGQPNGTANLYWTDGVCGDWAEKFTSMSAAYARLAVLIECGTRDWAYGFAETAEAFEDRWTTEVERSITA